MFQPDIYVRDIYLCSITYSISVDQPNFFSRFWSSRCRYTICLMYVRCYTVFIKKNIYLFSSQVKLYILYSHIMSVWSSSFNIMDMYLHTRLISSQTIFEIQSQLDAKRHITCFKCQKFMALALLDSGHNYTLLCDASVYTYKNN